MLHFKWKERTSSSFEDDFVLFPEDAEYVKVPQCNTGRVFLLKFKTSSAKHFFWMQEPSEEKDEANCSKINKLIEG
jgi:hypothetical protein